MTQLKACLGVSRVWHQGSWLAELHRPVLQSYLKSRLGPCWGEAWSRSMHLGQPADSM